MIIKCSECSTKFVVAPEAIGPEGRMVRCAKCSHVWHADPAPENHEIVPTKVIETPKPVIDPKPTPEPEVAASHPVDAPESPKKIEGADEDQVTTEDKVGDDGIPGEDLDAQEALDEEKDKFGARDDHGDDHGDEEEDDLGENLPALVKDRSKLVKIGWGLWAALMVGTIITFGFAQNWVEQAWPASKALYELVEPLGFSVGDDDAANPAKDTEKNSDEEKAETAKEVETPKGPTREELDRAVIITNTFKIDTIGGGRRDLVIDGTLRSTVDYTITLPQLAGVLKNSSDENIKEWNFGASSKELPAGATLTFRTVVQRIPADTAAYELFLLWPKDE